MPDNADISFIDGEMGLIGLTAILPKCFDPEVSGITVVKVLCILTVDHASLVVVRTF